MARVDNTGGAGYVIDNGTGAAVRTKLNQIAAAINSLNSGSGDPSINSAFQPHIDTGSSLFKIRNAANNAYVTIGNISLDQREQGFRKILIKNNVDVKTVPIDASDPSETREVVRAFLSSNKGVDGIMALGPLGAIPIVSLLKDIDPQKKISMATFDFTPEIIDGIMDGHIVFALDQQQYLQGYLPIVLMDLYITNKNTPAYKKLETGPSIINIENAQDVLALSKKGSR